MKVGIADDFMWSSNHSSHRVPIRTTKPKKNEDLAILIRKLVYFFPSVNC